MKFYYVPTITQEKHGKIPKAMFHVSIYSACEGIYLCEFIGEATLIINYQNRKSPKVEYFRVVSKYEEKDNEQGAVYLCNYISSAELEKEEENIVRACNELKDAWG